MGKACNKSISLVHCLSNPTQPLLSGRSLSLSGSRTRPEEASKIDTYEVMLIVIPELDEEQVESTVGRFRTVIERTGGEIGDVNNWGRRKLAYEIDHRADGFYYVMEFTAGERTLTELKRILRVSDDILRYMIVKLPPTYAHRPLPEPETAEVSG